MNLKARVEKIERATTKQVTLDDVLLHQAKGDYEEWAASLPPGAFDDLNAFLLGLVEEGHE